MTSKVERGEKQKELSLGGCISPRVTAQMMRRHRIRFWRKEEALYLRQSWGQCRYRVEFRQDSVQKLRGCPAGEVSQTPTWPLHTAKRTSASEGLKEKSNLGLPSGFL